MKFNDAGLKLIKEFEGCKLKAYRDIVGVITIGWGATHDDGPIKPGTVWTQAQADDRLNKDLLRFQNGVYDLLDVSLSDDQYSALVCFSYNLGLTALKYSHLLAKINDEDFEGAAEEFLKWCKAGGKVVPGLLRRRQAERALFLS